MTPEQTAELDKWAARRALLAESTGWQPPIIGVTT